jgi:hypothetical protein
MVQSECNAKKNHRSWTQTLGNLKRNCRDQLKKKKMPSSNILLFPKHQTLRLNFPSAP